VSFPLDGYRWLRLTSVPRVPDVPDPGRWLADSVAAAVSASHAVLRSAATAGECRPGIAVAWVRAPGSHRLNLLMGGSPEVPAHREGSAASRWAPGDPVLFPPGATAETVAADTARGWIASATHWVRCLAATDVDVPDQEGPASPGSRPASGLDDYALHLRTPFIWLTVAEPVGSEVLDEEAAATSVRLAAIRRKESSEGHRVELERGQRRMRELARARGSGLWRVHVLAGGINAVTARESAALLCSGVEAIGSGRLLFPDDQVLPLTEAWDRTVHGPDRSAAPFLGGCEVVATLLRPPAREVPGIRLLTPYRFDVTPAPAARQEAVDLGQVLDEGLRPAGAFSVGHATLTRHGFVCGATGSGKSQTGRRLLESLSTGPRRIPWLVVEPAKAEYATMAGRLAGTDDVLVIRPGDLAAAPASLNPLEPEPGFPLQSHADLVRALFLAAFQANEPFPQVLSHALTDVYTAAGWNLVSGGLRTRIKPKFRLDDADVPAVPRYPTLRELQVTARRVVDNIGYGREVAADVRGFVDVRMGSLRQGAPGRFFEGGHPLDIAGLLERNVVLELEPITSDQDKAFLMGTVLIRLVEHLRVRGPRASLAHVVLIEEAHRLLRNVHEGPAAAAVELFASLLAEIRAYGEGVVVIEQIPSKILPDVIKNTAFKVMHRLPAADDRDAVGATMNLSEENGQAVVSFPPGLAAVSVDGDDRPLLVAVDAGLDRETTAGARSDPPLRGRRSRRCGPDCRGQACSLRQLDDAARGADEPVVVVWAEAVAASVVMGITAPLPRRRVLDLWDGPGRRLDCALATLADRAVDARRTELRRWVDPDDFADRLRTVLDAQLRGAAAPATEPARWRAGPYRWLDVQERLRAAVQAAGDAAAAAAPHPMTQQWRAIGLDLDGATLAAQADQLTNDPAFRRGSERVLFGEIDTSGLRAALLDLAGSDEHLGLRRALQHACRLTEGDAVLDLLCRHFGEGRPERGNDGG
jgi:uncharacterized protein